VLTRLSFYIALALNYFQNKVIFSDQAMIIGREKVSNKDPVRGRLYKNG